MSEYFEIDGDNLKRNYKKCPECGEGYKMGEHDDRYTCGNCGYTEFKNN